MNRWFSIHQLLNGESPFRPVRFEHLGLNEGLTNWVKKINQIIYEINHNVLLRTKTQKKFLKTNIWTTYKFINNHYNHIIDFFIIIFLSDT